jgi:hypothetical protein
MRVLFFPKNRVLHKAFLKTLSGCRFERAIPRLLVGMAHFSNLEQE